MATVVKRTFKSTPYRDAHDTWVSIVSLLTNGENASGEDELMSVSGIAASIIAEKSVKDAPIVVTCEGPRTRIVCLYDDDAIDGSDANEEPLAFDALKGNWKLSLPCASDDLGWVESSLKAKSERITARNKDDSVSVAKSEDANGQQNALEIDVKGFLRS